MTTPLTDQVQQTGEGFWPVIPCTNVVTLDPTKEVKILAVVTHMGETGVCVQYTERDSEGIPSKTQLFIAYDEVVIANDQKSEPMDGLLVEECDFEATTIEEEERLPPRVEEVAPEEQLALVEPVVPVEPVAKLVRRPPFTSPGSAGKTGRTPQELRAVQAEWYVWQTQSNFKKRNAQQMLSSSSGSGSYSEESGSYSEESGSYSGESNR